jgi:hypothetical protein
VSRGLRRASRTVEEEIPSTSVKRAYKSIVYSGGGNSQYECQEGLREPRVPWGRKFPVQVLSDTCHMIFDEEMGKENENVRRKARIVMNRYKAGDD